MWRTNTRMGAWPRSLRLVHLPPLRSPFRFLPANLSPAYHAAVRPDTAPAALPALAQPATPISIDQLVSAVPPPALPALPSPATPPTLLGTPAWTALPQTRRPRRRPHAAVLARFIRQIG